MAEYTKNISPIEVQAGTWWKNTRLDYDGSGNLIYKGCHFRGGASPSDQYWVIWKLEWSSGNLVRIQGPLEGAWSDRASLGWT